MPRANADGVFARAEAFLLSLAGLATVPAWADRVLAVLAGLPGRHRRLQGPR